MASKKLDTPFKDCITPPPSFTIKDNLGNRPGQPTGGEAVAGIGKVSPHELPSTTSDLWHGPKG